MPETEIEQVPITQLLRNTPLMAEEFRFDPAIVVEKGQSVGFAGPNVISSMIPVWRAAAGVLWISDFDLSQATVVGTGLPTTLLIEQPAPSTARDKENRL